MLTIKDRIRRADEECFCVRCGDQLLQGDTVRWAEGGRPFCSERCAELDANDAADRYPATTHAHCGVPHGSVPPR